MKAVTNESGFCTQIAETVALTIVMVKVKKLKSTFIRILFHEKPDNHTF